MEVDRADVIQTLSFSKKDAKTIASLLLHRVWACKTIFCRTFRRAFLLRREPVRLRSKGKLLLLAELERGSVGIAGKS